jgi:hypothetical protein
MSIIERAIESLRKELHDMLLKGYSLNHPKMLKKSQELDKYVTAYYQYTKARETLTHKNQLA